MWYNELTEAQKSIMEIKRKLASIRIIKDIRPIPNADMIVLATVDGWKTVVKKDQFEIGDHCVYFEIDSFLPINEHFEFLRKSCFKSNLVLGEGFRLKTIRLRKQLSQGLAMSLDQLADELPDIARFDVDTDLTEQLGVQKWEQFCLATNQKGSFPGFIPKTDQDRLQNCFENWAPFPDAFEATLKLDGTSGTFWYDDEGMHACQRNFEVELENNDLRGHFKIIADRLEPILKLNPNLAFQGEVMGPKIQGNREKLTQFEFFVFDIFDISNNTYLLPHERQALCTSLGIQHVPVISNCQVMFETIEEAIEASDTIGSIVHKVAEGIVYKSTTGQGSFKVISNKFLLKCEI